MDGIDLNGCEINSLGICVGNEYDYPAAKVIEEKLRQLEYHVRDLNNSLQLYLIKKH